MSPRLPAVALLVLGLATACGEEPSSGQGRFGLELLLSRAVADQIAAFQVVVLPEGKQRNCTEIQRTCLNTQVKSDELLVLRDDKGTEGRALRFPVNLSGSGTTTQDISIEVPVGRDYALVIEAISGDAPPRFLGSSCNYLSEVNASGNAPVIAGAITLTDGTCDPTFD